MSARFNLGRDEARIQEAARYYNFASTGDFFRLCARVLIEHYERRDRITTPFQFEAVSSPNKEIKVRALH